MDIVEHDAADMSEDSLSKLSAEDIFEAIKLLPPTYRLVFTLYAVEGYKHEEIAKKLNISVGTSKSNLSKARVKLQGILTHGLKGFRVIFCQARPGIEIELVALAHVAYFTARV